MQQLEEVLRQPLRHELCHDGQEVRCVVMCIAPALLALQRLHIRRVMITLCPADCPASSKDKGQGMEQLCP